VEARVGSVSVRKNRVFPIFGFLTDLCDQFWENMRSVMMSFWMRFFFFLMSCGRKRKGIFLGDGSGKIENGS
jgi:hypothetical protein